MVGPGKIEDCSRDDRAFGGVIAALLTASTNNLSLQCISQGWLSDSSILVGISLTRQYAMEYNGRLDVSVKGRMLSTSNHPPFVGGNVLEHVG